MPNPYHDGKTGRFTTGPSGYTVHAQAAHVRSQAGHGGLHKVGEYTVSQGMSNGKKVIQLKKGDTIIQEVPKTQGWKKSVATLVDYANTLHGGGSLPTTPVAVPPTPPKTVVAPLQGWTKMGAGSYSHVLSDGRTATIQKKPNGYVLTLPNGTTKIMKSVAAAQQAHAIHVMDSILGKLDQPQTPINPSHTEKKHTGPWVRLAGTDILNASFPNGTQARISDSIHGDILLAMTDSEGYLSAEKAFQSMALAQAVAEHHASKGTLPSSSTDGWVKDGEGAYLSIHDGDGSIEVQRQPDGKWTTKVSHMGYLESTHVSATEKEAYAHAIESVPEPPKPQTPKGHNITIMPEYMIEAGADMPLTEAGKPLEWVVSPSSGNWYEANTSDGLQFTATMSITSVGPKWTTAVVENGGVVPAHIIKTKVSNSLAAALAHADFLNAQIHPPLVVTSKKPVSSSPQWKDMGGGGLIILSSNDGLSVKITPSKVSSIAYLQIPSGDSFKFVSMDDAKLYGESVVEAINQKLPYLAPTPSANDPALHVFTPQPKQLPTMDLDGEPDTHAASSVAPQTATTKPKSTLPSLSTPMLLKWGAGSEPFAIQATLSNGAVAEVKPSTVNAGMWTANFPGVVPVAFQKKIEAQQFIEEAAQNSALMEEAAKTVKSPAASPAPSAVFPATVDELIVQKKMDSGHSASLATDAQGNKYIYKTKPSNPTHIREEMISDQVYNAMGLPTAENHLYETPNGPVKVSAFISDATPLKDHMDDPAVLAQVRGDFTAHVLTANWDILGPSGDNVFVRDNGRVVYIDNGGALRTRGMGAPKGNAFTDVPLELWTMRHMTGAESGMNEKVFGDLSWGAIYPQMRKTLATRAAVIAATPADLHPKLNARFDRMEYLADATLTLRQAGVADGDIDRFLHGVAKGLHSGTIPWNDRATGQALVAKYEQTTKKKLTPQPVKTFTSGQQSLMDTYAAPLFHAWHNQLISSADGAEVQAQVYAIKRYTGSWAKQINGLLRKKQDLPQDHIERMASMDKALDSATWQGEPTELWRGTGKTITLPDGSIGSLLSVKTGDVFVEPGYGSVSMDKRTATDFTQGTRPPVILIRSVIYPGQKGLYVEPITECHNEYEVIRPRNMSYRVTEVLPYVHHQYGDVLEIFVEEI